MNRPIPALLLPVLVTTLLFSACNAASTRSPDVPSDPRYAFRVIPPIGSGLTAQDFASADIGAQSVDLTLEPATIAGRISLQGTSGAVAPYVDAPVTVWCIGTSTAIPGLALTSPAAITVPVGGTFSLPLSPGHWEIHAQSTDRTLPPVQTELTLAPRSTQDPRLTLVQQDLVKVTVLLSPTSTTSWPREDASSIPKFRYQVLSPISLQPISQASESVPANQIVSLWALPGTSQVVLRATPDSNNPALYPSKDFTGTVVKDLSGQWVTSFNATVLGNIGEPFSASGRVLNADQTPAGLVDVWIQATVTDGGQLSVHALSGADGTFQAQLLRPAITTPYHLILTPPPLSSSSARTERDADVDTLARDMILSPRIHLVGTVRDANGTPMSNLFVHAEPLLSTSSTPPDVGTDVAGAFDFWVDPGTYRLSARPDLTTHLAWSQLLWSSDSTAPVTLTVESGAETTGTVLANQTPLGSGATIQIYSVQGNDAVLLYQTATDKTGLFQAWLPTAPR